MRLHRIIFELPPPFFSVPPSFFGRGVAQQGICTYLLLVRCHGDFPALATRPRVYLVDSGFLAIGACWGMEYISPVDLNLCDSVAFVSSGCLNDSH